MLGLHPIDLQVSLEQMIPLVYKDHIYQHHKFLLYHHLVDLMDLQVLMEILPLHHLVDLMDLPVLVEILMGHPVLVEILHPLLPVEEGVVADPLLRHLAGPLTGRVVVNTVDSPAASSEAHLDWLNTIESLPALQLQVLHLPPAGLVFTGELTAGERGQRWSSPQE